MTTSTVERAYVLARSGQYGDLDKLKDRLKADGCRAVDALLAARSIRGHLTAICAATSKLETPAEPSDRADQPERPMSEIHNTSFADRQKASSEAKKALLAKFQPKPAVTDPLFAERAAMRAAELERVREERAKAKAAAKQAAADAERAAREAEEALQAASLEAKRGERKERKALTKAEQKAKRDARYAARKAR